MNKKEYMKPSMMVVKIQVANQMLALSDVGLHNEKSNNDSYSRESSWSDED